MLPPTPTEKESIIQLLLSPHAKNVQVALNLLESHPHWLEPLQEALEVFYFFDSRRYYGTIVFEFKAPLIEFVEEDGDVRDAHQLVGEWLEDLQEDFDGPLHPLFWLGSPDLLFDDKVVNEELDIRELEPSFALPELEFMEQQWAYHTYLDRRPDWWLVARGWASFIKEHLEKEETTDQLTPKQIEAYTNIAWQYYQKVLPHITEDHYYYYHQAALFLQDHSPTTVSKEKRKQLIELYFEKAMAFLTPEQEQNSDLLADYLLFSYQELEDSTQTFALFQKFAGKFLQEEEITPLQLACTQLGQAKAIETWINRFRERTINHVTEELNNYAVEFYNSLLVEKEKGTIIFNEEMEEILETMELLIDEEE